MLMFVTFWYFFELFSSYEHFLAKLSTRKVRPDTSVEIRARPVQSGARGKRSKFFIRREWIRRFPWFQYERPDFVSSTGKMLGGFPTVGSHEHKAQTYTRYQVDSRQHAQGTTLQRCRPYAVRVRHAHMRCTAVAGCVNRSLWSVFHRLPLFAVAI